MPAAKKKAPKSRTSKSAKSKKSSFKFHWWMGLILVVIIGGVGILVYRASFAGRECSTTPRGAICGGGPVQFRISNLQYNPNAPAGITTLSMDGHFPNNFNTGVYSLRRGEFYQDDAIYRLGYAGNGNVNTDCGRISEYNPLTFKSGRNVNFYSPNELRYGVSYAWWTPVGC